MNWMDEGLNGLLHKVQGDQKRYLQFHKFILEQSGKI
jgi:hypothetical protein